MAIEAVQTGVVQPELAVYQITTEHRRFRPIERVPVLGLLATPLVNLLARDWQQIQIDVSVPFDPNVLYSGDMRPTVAMNPGQYYRTYVSEPVIYPN